MSGSPSSASTASSGSSHSECNSLTESSPPSTEVGHQLPSVLTETTPPSPTLPYSAYSQPVITNPPVATSNQQRRYSLFSFDRKSTQTPDQSLTNVHRSDPNLKGKLMSFFSKPSASHVNQKEPNAQTNEPPPVSPRTLAATSFLDHAPATPQVSKQHTNTLSTSLNILKPLTDQQMKAHKVLMGTAVAEKSILNERPLSNGSSTKAGQHVVLKSGSSSFINGAMVSASSIPNQPVKSLRSPPSQEFSASAFALEGKESHGPSSKKLPSSAKADKAGLNRKSRANTGAAKKSATISSSDSESDTSSEDDDSQPLSDRRRSISHHPPIMRKIASQHGSAVDDDTKPLRLRKQSHSFSDLYKLGKQLPEVKGATVLPSKQQHWDSAGRLHPFPVANLKNVPIQHRRPSQPITKPASHYFMAQSNASQQRHVSAHEQFMPCAVPQMMSTPPLTPTTASMTAPTRQVAATQHVLYKQQPVGYAHPSQLGYQIQGHQNVPPIVPPQFYAPRAAGGMVGVQAYPPPQTMASQPNSAFGMYSHPQQQVANARPKTLIAFTRNEVETSKTLKDAAHASRAIKDRAKQEEILRARDHN
ncbi:hypothetical protein BJ741DRAFT_603027 [Chytriomyces cf. hyalinus JEL632]|nr:hypothetical protein BJ741DRAFT_603027 [Chytriomyces cf. hyalinus JEL632]